MLTTYGENNQQINRQILSEKSDKNRRENLDKPENLVPVLSENDQQC
jgi:hypothetical protein